MRAKLAGVVAVGLVLVAGCTAQPAGETVPSSTSMTGSPSVSSPEPVRTLGPGEVPMDEADDTTGGVVVVEWDAASQAQAVELAGEAITACGRPYVDEASWWEGLSPLLTLNGREEIAYTDPGNIPVHTVTLPGALVDTSSVYLGWVRFTTNAGPYDVLVVRDTVTGVMGVERISPSDAWGGLGQ